MKRIVMTMMAACMLLGAGLQASAQDTEYKATPVTISRDKVRKDGKLFYSHVVLERQTLFSISKAYGVSLQDIYDANPTLKLETEGLKTYQILMIPVVDNHPGAQEDAASPVNAQAKPAATDNASVAPAPQTMDYIFHTVKWFEDLNSIAKKYGVSKEAIMRANGMTSPTVTRKQRLKIPMGAAAELEEEPAPVPSGADEPEVDEKEEEKSRNIFDTIGEAITEKAEEWLYTGKNDITAALIMPFNAQKSPSENNLEFYSGVLLAAYDLKAEGINVDLSVYDAVGGNIPVTADKLSSCDVVIGPVSTADLTSTLRLAPSGTTIVSPLEPKAVDLARMYDNLVQAPSSSENQSEGLIDWLAEDFRTGDRIILLTQKNATLTSAESVMVTKLQDSGLPFTTISYGVLEGRNIASSIDNAAAQAGTTRLVVASESEAFVSDVVRHANLLALRNNRRSSIVVYGLSKVRSFDTIEIESLHNTNLHVAISYFVDYDSPAVQKFLMAYRALFNAEPGPFAFQGYDTAYTFIKMCSRYGRRWADKLDDQNVMRGLQSNFFFDHRDAHVNKAVRRVVYSPDFSIKLVN